MSNSDSGIVRRSFEIGGTKISSSLGPEYDDTIRVAIDVVTKGFDWARYGYSVSVISDVYNPGLGV